MGLFVDGRFPLACDRCDGEGEVPERGCCHSGNCPCGADWVICPSCLGSGVVLCRICGAAPAVSVDADGYEACERCAVREARPAEVWRQRVRAG